MYFFGVLLCLAVLVAVLVGLTTPARPEWPRIVDVAVTGSRPMQRDSTTGHAVLEVADLDLTCVVQLENADETTYLSALLLDENAARLRPPAGIVAQLEQQCEVGRDLYRFRLRRSSPLLPGQYRWVVGLSAGCCDAFATDHKELLFEVR